MNGNGHIMLLTHGQMSCLYHDAVICKGLLGLCTFPFCIWTSLSLETVVYNAVFLV